MFSREEIIQKFDPSGVGVNNCNLFGLPFSLETANIIVLGIPWEVTVSYRSGTANGPDAILQASPQLDLYDFDNPQGWKQGIFMPNIPDFIRAKNDALRPKALKVIDCIEQGDRIKNHPDLVRYLDDINAACRALNQWLYDQATDILRQGKRVGVIGGDHSVPLGSIQALAAHYPNFGILQIDAHADLRNAYQGFEFSHASIMRNVLKTPQVSKLIQVGVRDICQAEVDLIDQSQGRISTYYDFKLKQNRYAGRPWLELCRAIVQELPQHIYVSFDVDGLDPKLCPNTGTPVPGGLELEEVFCLLREVIISGRTLIGFDVCEVGQAEWDGNVGARIVYKLCNLLGLCMEN